MITIIAGIIVLKSKTQIKLLNHQNTNLNNAIETMDSLLNEMNFIFDEIEQSLTYIRSQRSQMIEDTRGEAQNQKHILDTDVKLMFEKLEESSTIIDESYNKLK